MIAFLIQETVPHPEVAEVESELRHKIILWGLAAENLRASLCAQTKVGMEAAIEAYDECEDSATFLVNTKGSCKDRQRFASLHRIQETSA